MAGGREYVVSGAVAVVPTRDGSERYMYRGARISSKASTPEGIEHLVGLGLLTEVDLDAETAAAAAAESEVAEAAAAAAAAAEKPADSWNHERIDAWAADQNPPVVFTGDNPTKAQKLDQIAALNN